LSGNNGFKSKASSIYSIKTNDSAKQYPSFRIAYIRRDVGGKYWDKAFGIHIKELFGLMVRLDFNVLVIRLFLLESNPRSLNLNQRTNEMNTYGQNHEKKHFRSLGSECAVTVSSAEPEARS
jgi:hypothetical protein